MRLWTMLFRASIGSCVALLLGVANATPPDFSAADAAISDAIAQHKCPGAVLLVGKGDAIVYEKAYGNRSLQPTTRPMTTDTIFDMASCTKPIATATSVMLLIDRGKIDVHAAVAAYLPEFGNHGKEKITVEMLLTHTGGLVPDDPMSDYDNGAAHAIAAICASEPKWKPGSHFAYSDVGFIVLGELVKRVDGRSIDRFTQEEIFSALGMSETCFLPPASLRDRIAPTEKREGNWIVGDVHDPRSFALGGVAGHAGLFSTARDVSRWCRMINAGGVFEGKRILGEATVKQMLAQHPLPETAGSRGLGVDIDSSFSSCRGERFARGTTFGHTGWTGTMFWSDPASGVYFVLLTNRVHPDGTGDVKPLRTAVATAVGEAMLGIEPLPGMGAAFARRSLPTHVNGVPWPFAERPDVEIVTTANVLDDRHPILVVAHDFDGTWQALCGATTDRDAVRFVRLGELFKNDPTLGELADMPWGWVARRSGIGAPWIREAQNAVEPINHSAE